MSFDFKTYLSEIDPTQTYTINSLTGGLVNLTVRAVKQPSIQISEGLFPSKQSIIIKHAPPFIAALGEEYQFSQFRQVCGISVLEAELSGCLSGSRLPGGTCILPVI